MIEHNTSTEKVRVGIIGGSGYTGSELLRLLVQHPYVTLEWVASESHSGTSVEATFPGLRGHIALPFADPSSIDWSSCDVVFFATPNGTAMNLAGAVLEAGAKVIDLAADFRLKDASLWERWYGVPHASPWLLREAVYGLPELNRSALRTAHLVANPGCYPTAVILALLPLVKCDAVELDHIVADAKSGVSGAGRRGSTALLMSEVGESFKAYNITGHRHHPEIVEILSHSAERPIGLTFVPHLVPMVRGLEVTSYVRWHAGTGIDAQALFEDYYRQEWCVDIMPEGASIETRWVRGSNLCRIAVARPSGAESLVIQSVLDNLVKGAAGQAIQNMNLMTGLEETSGLLSPPLSP